jgi:hypothetical protein
MVEVEAVKGIATTSWAANRLDLFYLNADLTMQHDAVDPTPFSGAPDVSLYSNILFENLGGRFNSVPAAVCSLVEPPPIVRGAGTVGGAAPPRAEAAAAGVPSPAAGGAGAAPHAAGGDAGPVIHPPIPHVPRIDVFGLGADYGMRHLELWNGKAGAPQPQWTNLGGVFISNPAAVAWDGQVDVLGVGLDRAMYRKTLKNNAWSPDWERLGGIFTSEATAVSWGPGRLDVFARGSDFTLRHKSYDGPAVTDWENFGGSLASPPAAVSWAPNRLDVFAIADDGTLAHKWWDGTLWNEWEYLGLPAAGTSFVAAPAATTWGPGRLDVFAAANDGIVYHYAFSGDTWASPEPLGGLGTPIAPEFSPSPIATSVAANQLNLWAPRNQVDYEGNSSTPVAGYRNFDGTKWRYWNTAGEVALPARYSFSVDYFTVEQARSFNQDTDTAQSTLKAGNWPEQKKTEFMGDWGGTALKQAQVFSLNYGPVTVELCEPAIFNYQIINSAEADKDVLDGELNKAGKAMVDYAISSIKKALGEGFTAITSIEIASITSVPVIGTILGLISGWLVEQLEKVLSAGWCDGTVAVEQAVLLGRDLHIATDNGRIYSVMTDHPGTDSHDGCGGNSDYKVMWSIRRM